MSEWDDLQVRVHGDAAKLPLIYLPGVHGDWTLVSSFRVALGERVRFVEFTYPRTLSWSLEDHARGVLEKLAAHGIREGWILAESFGSVVAWAILQRADADFAVRGVILAGGFVRYPFAMMVRVARTLNRVIPLCLIKALCWVYGHYAVLRHRHAPETSTASRSSCAAGPKKRTARRFVIATISFSRATHASSCSVQTCRSITSAVLLIRSGCAVVSGAPLARAPLPELQRLASRLARRSQRSRHRPARSGGTSCLVDGWPLISSR